MALRERTAEQAQRATGRMALLRNLPVPALEMPSWFADYVDTFYKTNHAFKRELWERRADAAGIVDARLKPVRDGCLLCRDQRRLGSIHGERAHLPPGLSCEAHRTTLDKDVEGQLEAQLRDEFAGEAAQAAMLTRKGWEDQKPLREATYRRYLVQSSWRKRCVRGGSLSALR